MIMANPMVVELAIKTLTVGFSDLQHIIKYNRCYTPHKTLCDLVCKGLVKDLD